jgi:hypothetical protein
MSGKQILKSSFGLDLVMGGLNTAGALRGRRCFRLRCREISDGSDHLPECTLHIHRDRRRSLWTPFRPCSAPSVPILGLATAVRGGHLQLDHGWNSAQSKTYGCNHCVKLLPSAALRRFRSFRFFPELEAKTKLYLTAQ